MKLSCFVRFLLCIVQNRILSVKRLLFMFKIMYLGGKHFDLFLVCCNILIYRRIRLFELVGQSIDVKIICCIYCTIVDPFIHIACRRDVYYLRVDAQKPLKAIGIDPENNQSRNITKNIGRIRIAIYFQRVAFFRLFSEAPFYAVMIAFVLKYNISAEIALVKRIKMFPVNKIYGV